MILLIIFLKTCSTNGKIEKVEKNLIEQSLVSDSLLNSKIITKDEIKKIITIEGLKSEKRMIQSTDRKILDVNRQSEIDKEIENLESK